MLFRHKVVPFVSLLLDVHKIVSLLLRNFFFLVNVVFLVKFVRIQNNFP